MKFSNLCVLIATALLSSQGAWAFGKAKPSASVDLQTVKLTNKNFAQARTLALKSGNIVLWNSGNLWNSSPVEFLSPSGQVLNTAVTQSSPGPMIQMADGSIVLCDASGYLYFFSPDGQAKPAIPDWGSRARPPQGAVGHFEYDDYDSPKLTLDRSGTVLAVAVDQDHTLDDATASGSSVGGVRRGMIRTFDSSGKTLGTLQLDQYPSQLNSVNPSEFIATTDSGKILRLNADLSIKNQLQFLDPHMDSPTSGDLHCVAVFPDGGLGVTLWYQNKIMIYGPDWSQAPVAPSLLNDQIGLSNTACAVTKSSILIVYTSLRTADSGMQANLFDEKGTSIASIPFKGDVTDTWVEDDGGFAIAYNPWTIAIGIIPIAGFPIPVGTSHATSNKINVVFYDQTAKVVPTVFNAGSMQWDGSTFLGSIGKYALISNHTVAYFVDPSTAKSVGNFPGFWLGDPVLTQDGSDSVVFADQSGNLEFAKLK